MSEKIVSIKSFDVSFGENRVLKSLNLDLEKGERLSILGPGKSGKTTLLKAILGIIPVQKGEIFLFQENMLSLEKKAKNLVRKKISMAFQLGALFDSMTVLENLEYAIENVVEAEYHSEFKAKIPDFLAQAALPQSAHKYPSELSGGMRRRVGVLRALITKPSLILLDEPTAGLDPITRTLIISMIHRFTSDSDMTSICVTSDMSAAFKYSKKVAVMDYDGRILGKVTWEELIKLGNPWISKFLKLRLMNKAPS